tara:strand:- start:3637 stop:3921 length:285 start_codon:yes stop_codon:yes gene_type:complete
MAEKKFIMLHCNEEQSKSVLEDGVEQGVERGLFVRSSIPKEIIAQFTDVKKRGYFPIGIVVNDSFSMEILFKRHPKQTNEMKMVELKVSEPTKL